MVKNLLPNAGDIRDAGSIPGLGRSPGGGHGNAFQYSCLENYHGQRSLAGYRLYGRKESRHNRSDLYTLEVLNHQKVRGVVLSPVSARDLFSSHSHTVENQGL